MTNTGSIRLPRSTPEEQGISSSAITDFTTAAENAGLELHSFMLVRHGFVVAEGSWSPYDAERPHMLFSLSKSFMSTAVGLAVQEGLLSLNDKVVSFFPEHAELYEGNDNLLRMSLHDLLSMATGHAEDTTGRIQADQNWVKQFLSLPVEHEPGTHFVYNSGASYMASAILQKAAGVTLFDYLKPRLFVPLGIEQAAWETCPKGITAGGWGLSIRTEDIAKFGQLYLQKGIWNGTRILSEEWVAKATSSQISNGSDPSSDWQQGYGYQFWRCRHGAYRGDGAFGQYCIVMPDQDAVIAITSGLHDMQAVLNLLWEHVLPSMGDAPLLVRQEHSEALSRKLGSLTLHPPRGDSASPVVDTIKGKQYVLTSEDQQERVTVSLVFGLTSASVKIISQNGEFTFDCGLGEWLEGTTEFYGKAQPISASGAWKEPNTFLVTIRFIETPFVETITFTFDGDRLRMERSLNVSFGPTKLPVMEGTSI